MNEQDFEGTLVLEMLAEVNKVDLFFDAIDSDDFEAARALMRSAGVDLATVETVLRMMAEASGEH